MSRSVRMVGAVLIPAFTLPLAGTATARSVDIPPPPTNKNLPKELDVASPYIPQSVCDPTPKPGVTAFARLMANHYDEFNYGISRACNYGLTEHSEGRALDWMLNAYDPHERAVADGVISWLLAPDSEGRPAAMARRFGIMYIIFDRQIWGTYQMEDGWRAYNGSSPHTDHIHFSFSWDGAMERTSWWTGAAWTGVTRGPGGPVVPLPDATSYPTLREGASGPDVQLAQKVIGVTADGAFGPATKSALRTWQGKNGVAVTGVLDEATWDAMVSNGDIPARGAATPGGALDKYLKTTIRLGSTGDSVKALQRELKVTADGAFGPQTEQAVKAFQKDKKLKVDGVVAPNVWRALAGLSYTKDGATSGTATGLDAYLKTTIRSGSRGDAVKALQRELKVTADGAFGPQTEQAVRTFQKAKQLKVDGVVTPNVWKALAGKSYTKDGVTTSGLDAYLKSTIRSGSRGAAVKALQRELKVTADGAFGSQTEQAVRTFQKSKKLKVDGVVTPNVWKALAGKSYTKDGVTTSGLDAYLKSTIRSGSRGAAVKALQRELKLTADGAFGPQTEQAVKAFQKSKKLKVDGVVTPNVWKALAGKSYTKDGVTSGATGGLTAYLKTTIRSGSRGDAVKALQRELKLTADGAFGPQTEQAVKAFQKSKKLKVDGVVTPNVWNALAGKSYTKVAATKAPTVSAKVVTTTEFDKLRSTVLANGARGAEVKVLQRALGGIAVDGSYGSGTVKAVRAFQEQEGLRVTGIADEKLWIMLERRAYPFLRYRSTVLKPGSSGQAVRALQSALGLAADGSYGSATKAAVRELQARHHLTRTGYVGSVTWQALEREIRSKG